MPASARQSGIVRCGLDALDAGQRVRGVEPAGYASRDRFVVAGGAWPGEPGHHDVRALVGRDQTDLTTVHKIAK